MNNFYDDILAYRNQKLTGKALEDFEMELKNNPDLRKAVDEGGLIQLFQEELLEQDIQQNIDQVLRSKNNNIKQSAKPTILRRLLPYVVAASVVLCLGFISLSMTYVDKDHVAINKEMLPIAKDSSAELKGDLSFPNQTDSDNDLAINYLNDDNIKSAKPLVENSLRSNNIEVRQEAEYLNMAILFMENDVHSGNKAAKVIANTDGHVYQKRAALVLDKIKKPWYILF